MITPFLYAVAVTGYTAVVAYCVTTLWFAGLVSVSPFQKSQRTSSTDPTVSAFSTIFVPVF